MINRYRQYLSILDEKLGRMFNAQKAFIKCKQGCAHCCKEGTYPFSELEYINLMFYYHALDEDVKARVTQNIQTLLNSNNFKSYVCPFLIDDSCSVYPARGLICRNFGLLSYYNDEKKKMPFCADLGLNYAEACDVSASRIVNRASDGTEPIAYNIDRRTLRDKNIEETFNITFGEDKALYKWLMEDFCK